MLVNREVILFKIEASYGVDALPTEADDAVLVEEPSWAFEGLRMVERPAVRQSIGRLQKIYGGTLKQVTFNVEKKASGAAGTAPEFGALLLAAKMSETIAVGVSVTYEPDSLLEASGTLYYYQDGILHKMLGCVVNVAGNYETGNKGMLSFTVTGHAEAEVDAALPTSPVYSAKVPPPFINAAFVAGGFSSTINALAWDLGNTIATPPDAGSPDGYAQIRITQRAPTGSYDPESTIFAGNYDPFADLRAGNALPITTGEIGAAAGERWAWTAGAANYDDVAPGDRDGVRTWEIPLAFNETVVDDEITLTFT